MLKGPFVPIPEIRTSGLTLICCPLQSREGHCTSKNSHADALLWEEAQTQSCPNCRTPHERLFPRPDTDMAAFCSSSFRQPQHTAPFHLCNPKLGTGSWGLQSASDPLLLDD